MRLRDLNARFVQAAPLADGIYTGLYYLCPNDPKRKRGHVVHFSSPINPYNGTAGLDAYLAPHTRGPKWERTGATIDDLTLSPSIAYPCCHLTIAAGEVAGS